MASCDRGGLLQRSQRQPETEAPFAGLPSIRRVATGTELIDSGPNPCAISEYIGDVRVPIGRLAQLLQFVPALRKPRQPQLGCGNLLVSGVARIGGINHVADLIGTIGRIMTPNF